MNKTVFVRLLPEETQGLIEQELVLAGITGEDLENAMNSRLSDLEDTIDINKYL